MPALDHNLPHQDTSGFKWADYPVAPGSHVYENSLVGLNASEKLVPMTDAAGLVFIGRANGEVNNPAAATEDIFCSVTIIATTHVNNTGTAVRSGDTVMGKFGNEVQKAGDGVADNPVGKVLKVVNGQADLLVSYGF